VLVLLVPELMPVPVPVVGAWAVLLSEEPVGVPLEGACDMLEEVPWVVVLSVVEPPAAGACAVVPAAGGVALVVPVLGVVWATAAAPNKAMADTAPSNVLTYISCSDLQLKMTR
jgi:hypothetical protein